MTKHRQAYRANWYLARQLAKNPEYVQREKIERVPEIKESQELSQEGRNPYFREYFRRTNHAAYLKRWRAARKGAFCADCGARLNDQTCWCIYAP